MANKLFLTPTEINTYACSAIVSQLCDERSVAEACIARNLWDYVDICDTLVSFLSEEFFWDLPTCAQYAAEIYNEMFRVAQTVQVGINDIEAAFVEAGAPVTD